MHKYKLRYDFSPETRPEGYTKDEAGEKGLCDALLFISIIHNDDGSYSQALFSLDGKEERDLTQQEIFKAWTMMGLSLADEGKLKGWKKDCVEDFKETIREMFKMMKGTIC